MSSRAGDYLAEELKQTVLADYIKEEGVEEYAQELGLKVAAEAIEEVADGLEDANAPFTTPRLLRVIARELRNYEG